MSTLTIRALIRISQIGLEKRPVVHVRLTKLLARILKLLFECGYISGWCLQDIPKRRGRTQNEAVIFPRFFRNKPVLKELRIISKPSHRFYVSWKQLEHFSKDEKGILIVSTPEGVITATQAINRKLGGELLLVIR